MLQPSLRGKGIAVSWIHSDSAEESLNAKLGVMLLILSVSLLAVTFPTASKSERLAFLKIPRIVFFIGKHFGTGVILCTAFAHLLQDAFNSLQDPEVRARWGIARHGGLIILGSLLAIFLVEYISTAYVDYLHSYPSAPSTPQSSLPPSPFVSLTVAALPSTHANGDNEETPLLAPSPPLEPDLGSPFKSLDPAAAATGTTGRSKTFAYGAPALSPAAILGSHPYVSQQHVFFDGHHRYEPRVAHEGHHQLGGRQASQLYADEEARADAHVQCLAARDAEEGRKKVHRQHEHSPTRAVGGHRHGHGFPGDEERQGEEDEQVQIGVKRQIVGISILQLGIMLHSCVIGLTLAIASGSEFTSLVTAITFHQLFEGLSLGVRIAALPPTLRTLRWMLAALFAVTTPLGMAVGLLLFSDGADKVRLRFTQGLLSSVSAGLLIYAACVEMLAADFVMDPHLWRSSKWRQALALLSLLAGAGGMAWID